MSRKVLISEMMIWFVSVMIVKDGGIGERENSENQKYFLL